MPVPTVVLLGTLDTKGHEFAFVRDRLAGLGVRPLLVDAGILGPPLAEPDVGREEVAAAAGEDVAALAVGGDRGAALAAMARGAAEIVARLRGEGRLDALFGMGGSGSTTLLAEAAKRLPVGVPKLLVSTLAAGDTRPIVGTTDLTLMYPVVDIAGLNRLSERILGNAAAAVAGMARAAFEADRESPPAGSDRPLVGATMFGVTTAGVTAARARLEDLGYEVLVFHATGTGGDAMEGLVESGFLAGVLDLTTTELADELAGGVLPAGPLRLRAGAERGVPRVVSLGALDMVNFGPFASVPDRYQGRTLHRHNEMVTLMRTTPEETAELGRRLAERLNALGGAAELFVPLRGVSQIAVAGGPFHDAAADEALVAALREHLSPGVAVYWLDTDVNDPAFARGMADALDARIRARAAQAESETA